MSETVEKPKLVLSWEDVEQLVISLADELEDEHFDWFLGISRGGLIPAALLAKRLNHFNVLVASIQYYDAHDVRLPHPVVLQFPPEPILYGKRVLVVDDVWHTGHTLRLTRKMAERAGAHVEVATLHFKPNLSEVDGCPDYFAAETDDWIVYPWERVTKRPPVA